jgi:hypothetical protein
VALEDHLREFPAQGTLVAVVEELIKLVPLGMAGQAS